MPDQHTVPNARDARLQIPFGILLSHQERIAGQQRDKGNIVLFGHRVRACDEIIVFNVLHSQLFALRSFDRLHSGKSYAAAEHRRLGDRGQDIATLRAYIKF